MRASIVINYSRSGPTNSVREVVDTVFPFPSSSTSHTIKDTFVWRLFANFIIPFEYMVSLIVLVVRILESFLQPILIIVFARLIHVVAGRNMFKLATLASNF